MRLIGQPEDMLVTVTLNPSLDRTLSVPELHPGKLHRARLLRVDLSGKGVNISRALQALGLPSLIVCFAGGQTGRLLRDGLSSAGFAVSFIEIPDEIRQNITLLDESTGQYTKINEPGPPITPGHITALEDLVEHTVQPGDLWAFCGSLPPDAPSDLYTRLITRIQSRQALAFLDSSRSPLREGLRANPFALKINSEEAGELLGGSLEDDQAILDAASQLQAGGIHLVVITRGAQGLVLVTSSAAVIATPPPVVAHSPIGAGDATLAGLLWSVTDQCDPRTTARRAVACGTAAAMQPGTAMGNRALIQDLLPKINIREGK